VTELIAVVQVVAARIVEVDRELDQPQAKDAGVKVDIPLGITGDGGDVVETGRSSLHHGSNLLFL
jgi:hypothetical protein